MTDQTINFDPLADRTYGDPPFTLGASASSGLPVRYVASGACGVTGATVTITGVGSCTIIASQSGDANWNPAPSVPQTFTVLRATPVLAWNDPAPIAYGTALAANQLNASASIPGAFTYDPDLGTMLDAGIHNLSAAFTPIDTINYTGTTKTVSLLVTPADQTISFDPLPAKTYGDPAFTLGASASSGLPVSYGAGGACSVLGDRVTITGAGSCTITASQLGDVNRSAAMPVARSFAIKKQAVEVTVDAGQTKVYGGADPLPFVFTISAGSLVSGDVFSGVLGRAAGETAKAYAITQDTLTLGSNYDLSFVGDDFTITPKAASVTANAASKVYGSADPSLGGALTGFLATDGITAAFSRIAGETVAGSPYLISATLSPAGVLANYDITYKAADFKISRAPLTVSANDKTRAYGSPNPSFDASYAGFADGETPAVLGGSLTCRTTATASSPIGTYPITCAGLSSPNYDITYVPGTLTIGQADQTIAFGSLANRTYGVAAFTVAATTSSGLAVTFAASGDCAVEGTTVTITGAGDCTVTASQAGDANHHPATSVSRSFSIAPAALTITANDRTRTYGAPNPALGVSYAGFVYGETPANLDGTLACTTTATASSGVTGSPYPITCSGLTSPDYAITFVAGKLAVTRAPLTVTAVDTTRLLGATTPPFAATYAGFVNGETTAVLGGSLMVAPTTSVSTTAPGVYVLRASGLTSSNYAIGYVDGRLTVIYRICLLYDATKPVTGSSVPIKLFICNTAGTNLSKSTTTLTAIEIDRGTTKVTSASGTFTFGAKLTTGGGYQYNVPTKGLIAGQKIAYSLKFRVSTDPPAVYQSATFIFK